MKEKTMEHKKTQVATYGDACSSVLQGAGARFGGRSCRQSFAADLTSIVYAAYKLPAEVAPPARVWISLRATGKRRHPQSFDKGKTRRAHAISNVQELASRAEPVGEMR
jgi:hypothetical protein